MTLGASPSDRPARTNQEAAMREWIVGARARLARAIIMSPPVVALAELGCALRMAQVAVVFNDAETKCRRA